MFYLNNFSPIQNHYFISNFYHRQPVCYHNHTSTCITIIIIRITKEKIYLDVVFTFCIQGTSSLIKDQNSRVSKNGPGKGNALLLAST
nr:hypothetical protein Iba_chr05fCG5190 [Ipomoea batatas]